MDKKSIIDYWRFIIKKYDKVNFEVDNLIVFTSKLWLRILYCKRFKSYKLIQI